MRRETSRLTASGRENLVRSGFVIGHIVCLKDGLPIVDYAGNPGAPLEARVAIAAPADFDERAPDRIPVLLLIDNDEPLSPIIVGFVSDRLSSPYGKPEIQMPRDVLLDGRRMVFTASQEIVLRCGKGSIYLARDGKIVVKGVNIVSRSSGTNKVKGAAVKIN